MSLKYEPSSEPLLISVKQLFSHLFRIISMRVLVTFYVRLFLTVAISSHSGNF